MKRRRAIFATLCVVGLVASSAGPAGAVAQGIKVDPFILYPAAAISETYDDNLFLDSSGTAKADWLTTLSASLGIALPYDRYRLQVEGGAARLIYAERSENDSTNWHVGGSLGADFPGGLSFEVADAYRSGWVVQSQEFGPGEGLAVNNASAKIGFAIRDDFRFEINGFLNSYDYDRSLWRDRDEYVARGTLYWKILPRTSLLAEAGYAEYNYARHDFTNGDQDSATTQVLAGLAWDVTSKSTGVIKLGYQWKDYVDAAMGNPESFVGSAKLRHFFTRRTMAEVEVSRSSQESDFVHNPYYLQTAVTASFSQHLTPKLYGRVGVTWDNHDYPTATASTFPYNLAPGSPTRSDDTLGGSLTLGFDVLRWLNLELSLATDRRSSNFTVFEYTDNRVSFAAKAAF